MQETRAEAKKPKPVIKINQKWCKACGICVELCSKNVWAFGENGKAYPQNPERCNMCKFCENHCPDFAISIYVGGGEE